MAQKIGLEQMQRINVAEFFCSRLVFDASTKSKVTTSAIAVRSSY